jgi:hypothetical protein
MRHLVFGIALLAAVPALAQPKAPPPTPIVTGPPVSCINLRNIRGTKVIDDKTIDFHMAGKKVFRNTLPNRCPQLGFERAFAYQTSISQLCSVDIITVIVQGSPSMRGATCGLGQFTPISFPPNN